MILQLQSDVEKFVDLRLRISKKNDVSLSYEIGQVNHVAVLKPEQYITAIVEQLKLDISEVASDA